jgi:hypothetical protein
MEKYLQKVVVVALEQIHLINLHLQALVEEQQFL